jgi:hypothetical protein
VRTDTKQPIPYWSMLYTQKRLPDTSAIINIADQINKAEGK